MAVSKLKIKGDEVCWTMSQVEQRRANLRRLKEQDELIAFFIRNYNKSSEVQDVLYQMSHNKGVTDETHHSAKPGINHLNFTSPETKMTPSGLKDSAKVTTDLRTKEPAPGLTEIKSEELVDPDSKNEPSDENASINKDEGTTKDRVKDLPENGDLHNPTGSKGKVNKINQIHGLGTISEEKDHHSSRNQASPVLPPGVSGNVKNHSSNGVGNSEEQSLDYKKLKAMSKTQLIGLKRQST